MRFIKKSRAPKRFRDWKKAMRGLPDENNYEAVPTDVKDSLRKAMRREQGDLCAYTMARIDARTGAHVEHLQPQKHFPERATDFGNMLLCVPAKGPCEYGAIKKHDTLVDDSNFVSPLNEGCESRLRYRLSGEVVARAENDEAAKNTIKILNLNHGILVSARRNAFRAQGIVPAARAISAMQAFRLSKAVLQRDSFGRFPPYCIAVAQVAETFALQSKSRARRLAKTSE